MSNWAVAPFRPVITVAPPPPPPPPPRVSTLNLLNYLRQEDDRVPLSVHRLSFPQLPSGPDRTDTSIPVNLIKFPHQAISAPEYWSPQLDHLHQCYWRQWLRDHHLTRSSVQWLRDHHLSRSSVQWLRDHHLTRSS